MNGSFEILNWGDGTNGFPPGVFVMALYRDFDKALWGGGWVGGWVARSVLLTRVCLTLPNPVTCQRTPHRLDGRSHVLQEHF